MLLPVIARAFGRGPIVIAGLTCAVLAMPATASAQSPESAAAQAMAGFRECSALVANGKLLEAVTPARRVETQLKAYVARNPKDADAMVVLARTLSQCLIPSSKLMERGELSAESIELLQNALAVNPRHWTARFVLANIYLGSPSFLGRGPLAAKELDELLRQQGDRNDEPMYARVFEMRGRMLSSEKLSDSARAVWAKGSRLFPDDSVLRALAGPPTPPTAPPVASTALQAVRVVARAGPPPSALPSVREVSRSTVLMTAGGTADVLQGVQVQPGATRVNEGSDIYTRGGGASETALMVDGSRMLSLARFETLNGGLFGALDPFVVKSVRYSSGGFSAKFGNALSGVLEIGTDGRPRKQELRGGLSMAQGSFSARAPINSKVGAWASARLSNTGVILATHGRTGEFSGAPHSEELTASIIVNPSLTSELRATVIAEQDDARRIVNAAGWEGPFHAAASARTALLSSRWMSGGGTVVVRSNVAASTRTSAWDFGVLSRDRNERSVSARTDLEWTPSDVVALRGGVEHGRLARGEDGVLPTTGVVTPGAPVRNIDGTDARASQLGAYSEAEVSRGGVSMIAGVRADKLPGETQVTIDPRLSLSMRRGAWTSRLGGGVFHQGRWQSAPAIPDAATPAGTPREAWHLVAGIEHDGLTTLRAEVYDKRYRDYSPLGAGPQIQSANARGLDVSAQRAIGSRVTGWVGYSLLDATVRLVDGRKARSPYDITHTATASTTVTLNSRWSVGTTARYGTGAPFTPVTGATGTTNGSFTPIYGAVSSERLPAYARLDARVMRYAQLPKYLLTSFVEVINLSGRANTSSITYDATYRSRQSMHPFFASRTIVAGAEVQRH